MGVVDVARDSSTPFVPQGVPPDRMETLRRPSTFIPHLARDAVTHLSQRKNELNQIIQFLFRQPVDPLRPAVLSFAKQ